VAALTAPFAPEIEGVIKFQPVLLDKIPISFHVF
jgi:hypothetical protein